MPEFTDHLRLAVLIDGVFQASVTNVEINGQSGAQAVETLQGLAGKTPGSARVEISGTWAVPIGGLEFDFLGAALRGEYHTIQVPLGDKAYIGNGWFQDAGVSQGTGSNTEAKMNWVGEPNPPE